jgi:hypothetical protein
LLSDFDTRLDQHAARLGALEDSDVKTQLRLTALEDDRESVRNLVTTIGLLADKVSQGLASVDLIAERAVTKVLHERSDARRDSWKHRMNFITLALGATGAAITLWSHAFGLFHH